MSFDTTEHILWPYDREDEIYCQCGEAITTDDYFIYKNEPICDNCQSEITALEISLLTE